MTIDYLLHKIPRLASKIDIYVFNHQRQIIFQCTNLQNCKERFQEFGKKMETCAFRQTVVDQRLIDLKQVYDGDYPAINSLISKHQELRV